MLQRKVNRLCRSLFMFIARKAYRHRSLIFASLSVYILILWLCAPLLRRSKFRRASDISELAVVFTSGDVTITGAKAYARGWVGFSSLQQARVNCSEALVSPRRNFLYPQLLPRLTPDEIIEECLQGCEAFRERRGFNRHPKVTREELQFPIAFIILMHKDLDQVLFLLRAIYRPHNVYCLSVDLSADRKLLEAVRAVSGCFPNVFVASKLEDVVYAGFTRLLADLHCMEDLLRHKVLWKYVINMSGQQFPLKSNLEMVKVLKIYNGAKDVLGDPPSKSLLRRYKYKHHVVIARDTGLPTVAETVRPHVPPPHGFKVVKGSAYYSLTRAFVAFVLRHPWARDLIRWSKDIESPDEYVWATLHHSNHVVVPGGYSGVPHQKSWLTSYTAWQGVSKCASSFVRWICIFSPGDLPRLVRQRHLFANKFYIDRHPAALHCLDQYVYNLTVSGTVRGLDFYRKLPFIVPYNDFDN